MLNIIAECLILLFFFIIIIFMGGIMFIALRDNWRK